MLIKCIINSTSIFLKNICWKRPLQCKALQGPLQGMICVCFQRAELYLRFAGIICVFDKGHVAHKGSHDHFNPEVFHVCRMERQPRQFVVPHLSLPMHGRKVVRVTWSEPAREREVVSGVSSQADPVQEVGVLGFCSSSMCASATSQRTLPHTPHPLHP